MNKLLLLTALVGFAAAGSAIAENDHTKVGHQHRDAEAEQGAMKVASTDKAAPAADGKRLPGRDCKLYEGGTRQHTYPAYEIGNPNRPECPPEAK